MTAEIAVMNSGAIALAADSAASITYAQGLKVYNSADKLFQLDGRSPVGVMVYGSAQFAGVPWETVIKLYRGHHSGPHDYLRDYAGKFIEFLKSNSLLSDDHIDTHFQDAFHSLANDLREQITSAFPAGTDPSTIDFSSEVKKFCDNFAALPRLDECDDAYEAYLSTHYQTSFLESFDQIFEKLGDEAKQRATKLILNVLVSRPSPQDEGASGLVIAGFGEAELYPSAWRCLIRGILPKRILQFSIQNDSISSITLRNGAFIVPFAQKEMVDNFMTGVDPEFEHHFFSAVGNLLTEFVDHFTEKVKTFGDPARSADYEKEARDVAAKTLMGLRKEMQKYVREQHIDPIISAVAVLPKDELAFMAETLVALTSFKRRVSNQAQTVGGAIDVAVISKGDGFVWIKRKHYFDPALNVRYINRIQKS